MSHLIRNVPVEFPFQPYQSQLLYMEKVIEALQTGSNALLESPTGTGKTMSLLCSTLAWRQAQEAQLGAANTTNKSAAAIRIQYSLQQATGMSAFEDQPLVPTDEHGWARRAKFNRDRDGFGGFASGNINSSSSSSSSNSNNNSNLASEPPRLQPRQNTSKIIYTARTHSQLSQVVKELKGTAYRPNVCILGSRQQLCVHPKVSKEHGTKQNRDCQTLVKARKCRYHTGVEEYLSRMKISTSSTSNNRPESGTNANASAVSSFHINSHSFSSSQSQTKAMPVHQNVIQDIEELHAFGKSQQVCPYYLSRQRANADIFFMPYNYLVGKYLSEGASIANGAL